MEGLITRQDTLRRMGPLSDKHHTLKLTCPGCDQLFKEGEYVTLVTIGPGDNIEEAQKCREGRPYNAVAIPVHFRCATGRE